MYLSRLVRSIRNCTARLFAITFGVIGVLALSSTMAFASPADLKNDLGDPTSKNPIVRGNTGELIAGCAGEISNGYGEVELNMPYGNYWADIQFSTGYNNGVSGAVECYVEFPTGTTAALGTVSASSGISSPIEFFFCPYGTYTFIFEANVLDELDVAGFVYD